MNLMAPSQKWRSQKLAVLESLSNWLVRRLELTAFAYFAAFGLCLHWWLQINIGSSESISNTHTLLVAFSTLLLIVLGPVLLAFCFVLKQIQRRINH